MSAISIGGDLVHYEVLGRGRPVVLLHGWIGSWRYWVPTMQQLQSNYRIYALDLFGFGDSGKNPQKYSLEHQLVLLDDFMKQLGIPKAAVIGHGLGALIALTFARRYPDRIPRLLLVSAPLFDTHDLDRRTPAGRKVLLTSNAAAAATSPLDTQEFSPSSPTAMSASAAMRAALIEAARARNNGVPVPPSAEDVTINRLEIVETPNQNPLVGILGDGNVETLLLKCFKRSEVFYTKLDLDTPKTDSRALTESIRTFDAGRVLDTMRLLPMPTMVVHGMEDRLINPPPEEVWNYITLDKENLLLHVPLPGVRHFPMLEDERFFKVAMDFLEASDLSKVAVKERWRRRTR